MASDAQTGLAALLDPLWLEAERARPMLDEPLEEQRARLERIAHGRAEPWA